MSYEFRLADIGEGLEEAEIVRWLVAVGDRVERDQPVIEVMTDKSNAELPAPEAGVIVGLGGAVGDILEVGEVIATIDTGSDATAEATDEPSAASEAAAPPPPTESPGTREASSPAQASPAEASPAEASPAEADTVALAVRPKASPSTRRVAVERGIDLTTIRGTGPGGRILLADLDTAVPATDTEPPTAELPPLPLPAPRVAGAPADPPAPPDGDTAADSDGAAPPMAETPPLAPAAAEPVPTTESGTSVPLRGVRRAIARSMAQSWSEIPHIHSFDEIDASALLDLRERMRSSGRTPYEHLTPLAFFVAAVARALSDHPQANSSIDTDADTITTHPAVNVGIAVAAPQGLVVPVVHDAARLGFPDLVIRVAQLVDGARRDALDPAYFRGGTVTITNFGSLGGVQATPLIRPPESAIFGFGAVAERPWVSDGEVVVRNTLPLVIGADHRLLDGDVTTTLLRSVADALSDPLVLVI